MYESTAVYFYLEIAGNSERKFGQSRQRLVKRQ
jgi:hypothetical protein